MNGFYLNVQFYTNRNIFRVSKIIHIIFYSVSDHFMYSNILNFDLYSRSKYSRLFQINLNRNRSNSFILCMDSTIIIFLVYFYLTFKQKLNKKLIK